MMTDKNTTLELLKERVARFCAERDWDQFHNPKDLAIGAVTEASELLEIFRFQNPEQELQIMQNPDSRRAIGQELSDVLFFLLRFAQKHDFDLSQEFVQKLQLNAKKYPADQYRGRNQKAKS